MIDYFPGLTSAEKKDRLSRMSYGDYLSKIAGAVEVAIPYYQKITHDGWGVGIDAGSALDCWGFGFPGFLGLNLEPKAAPRMGNTAAGYVEGGSYMFHFPDGNASIARLLVRATHSLGRAGPGLSGHRDGARGLRRLDRDGRRVRIRLSATAPKCATWAAPPIARRGGRLRPAAVFSARGRTRACSPAGA